MGSPHSPLSVQCTAVVRRVVIPCLAFASGLTAFLIFYVHFPECHSGVPCIVCFRRGLLCRFEC